MGTRYNRLSEADLTSTHNLCFGAKIRKYVYPSKPHFFYIKVGCKVVFITRTCYPDGVYRLFLVRVRSRLLNGNLLGKSCSLR